MTGNAALLEQAAQHFIGAPFRLHGRDPATGLDCVGLVAAALAAMNRSPIIPHGYALRNSDITPLLAFARLNGFEERGGQIKAGDLIMVGPGPAQLHLLIAENANSFIHAHAGLRRVVRMPGPLGWTVIRHWRLAEED